jgi:hypothetical protein
MWTVWYLLFLNVFKDFDIVIANWLLERILSFAFLQSPCSLFAVSILILCSLLWSSWVACYMAVWLLGCDFVNWCTGNRIGFECGLYVWLLLRLVKWSGRWKMEWPTGQQDKSAPSHHIIEINICNCPNDLYPVNVQFKNYWPAVLSEYLRLDVTLTTCTWDIIQYLLTPFLCSASTRTELSRYLQKAEQRTGQRQKIELSWY